MKHHVLLGIFIVALLSLTACHSSKRSAQTSRGRSEQSVGVDRRPDIVVEKPSAQGGDIVKEARKWLGTKYKYGGETKKGTDCSGMVMKVYLSVTGLKLPRDSRSQRSHCEYIKRHELMPGDLVFFASKAGGARVGHVGIYSGAGRFIHASTSRGVIESRLEENYYSRHFHSAGRVPGASTKGKRHTEKPPRPDKEPKQQPAETKQAEKPRKHDKTPVKQPVEPQLPVNQPVEEPVLPVEPTPVQSTDSVKQAPDVVRPESPRPVKTNKPDSRAALDSLLRADIDTVKQNVARRKMSQQADSLSADSIKMQVLRALF